MPRINCVYLAGGRNKVPVSHKNRPGSLNAALLLRISLDDKPSTGHLEYITPPEIRGGDLGDMTFKSGAISGDTLYLCTPTEVMAFRRGLDRTHHISLPCFNDVHHVCPTPEGNLLIVSTGLDMVVETTANGEILREWGVFGKSPWEHFSREVDYRKVVNTKPHTSHPNFVFQTGEDVWVTRFHQRDSICLTYPGKRIDIGVQGPHDGHVRGDLVYFTTVDGHVVVGNHRTQKVEHISKLLPPDRNCDCELGWCRGLLPMNNGLAWVGFSRIRPTKYVEYVSWIKHGFRTYRRPSRLALYDLNRGECLREISVEPYGMNAIFSILDGAAFESPQPAEAQPELTTRKALAGARR